MSDMAALCAWRLAALLAVVGISLAVGAPVASADQPNALFGGTATTATGTAKTEPASLLVAFELSPAGQAKPCFQETAGLVDGVCAVTIENEYYTSALTIGSLATTIDGGSGLLTVHAGTASLSLAMHTVDGGKVSFNGRATLAPGGGVISVRGFGLATLSTG